MDISKNPLEEIPLYLKKNANFGSKYTTKVFLEILSTLMIKFSFYKYSGYPLLHLAIKQKDEMEICESDDSWGRSCWQNIITSSIMPVEIVQRCIPLAFLFHSHPFQDPRMEMSASKAVSAVPSSEHSAWENEEKSECFAEYTRFLLTGNLVLDPSKEKKRISKRFMTIRTKPKTSADAKDLSNHFSLSPESLSRHSTSSLWSFFFRFSPSLSLSPFLSFSLILSPQSSCNRSR